MTTPVAAADSTPLTRDTTAVRGRFLWYDLMTPDVDAATRFYAAITGWTLTPWASGEQVAPYRMWTNGPVPIGGLMPLSVDEAAGSAPAYWLAYIGTPDVDATYAQAVALGAHTFVAPSDIPAVGRFAVLADPQGAAFAVFQPANPRAEAPGMPPVGAFSWFELATTDRVAAADFYAQLFGWTPTTSMDMGDNGVYQMFGQGGITYGGIFDRRGAKLPPHWLLYVRVVDMDRALDAVRQGGGQVLNGPMEVPGGDHVAQCLDPQGAPFAVHVTAHGAHT